MNINLSLCHKWARIAYAQQLQSTFHSFQYDATYKDYVCYAMKHFNLVKSYFTKLRIKEFLSNVNFTFNLVIDTVLQLFVGVVVAFMLSFMAIKFTSGLTFIGFSFVIVLITACNLLQAYDNIRNKVNKFNEFNKIKGY